MPQHSQQRRGSTLDQAGLPPGFATPAGAVGPVGVPNFMPSPALLPTLPPASLMAAAAASAGASVGVTAAPTQSAVAVAGIQNPASAAHLQRSQSTPAIQTLHTPLHTPLFTPVLHPSPMLTPAMSPMLPPPLLDGSLGGSTGPAPPTPAIKPKLQGVCVCMVRARACVGRRGVCGQLTHPPNSNIACLSVHRTD